MLMTVRSRDLMLRFFNMILSNKWLVIGAAMGGSG